MRYQTNFVLDDITYLVSVDDDGQIAFAARARDPALIGMTPDPMDWDMPDFYQTTMTTNANNAPLRVFRGVADALLPWIRKNLPDNLYFYCRDADKMDVYRRLLNRFNIDDLYIIQDIAPYIYLARR